MPLRTGHEMAARPTCRSATSRARRSKGTRASSRRPPAAEDIGGAPLWNRFVATVADGVPGWEPDLMVVSVQMWPWYKSSGSPDVPAAPAAPVMVEDARTRVGAQDPVAGGPRAT